MNKKLEDLLRVKIKDQKPSDLTKQAVQSAWDQTADQRYWTEHVKKVEWTRG